MAVAHVPPIHMPTLHTSTPPKRRYISLNHHKYDSLRVTIRELRKGQWVNFGVLDKRQHNAVRNVCTGVRAKYRVNIRCYIDDEGRTVVLHD